MMRDSCGSVAEIGQACGGEDAVWMRSKYTKIRSFSGYKGSVSRCSVCATAGCTLPPPLFTLHHPTLPLESTLPVDYVASKS